MMARLFSLLVVATVLLPGCGKAEEKSAPTTFEGVVAGLEEPKVEPVTDAGPPLADADLGRVCKATIAILMGKPVSIMRLEKVEGGVAYVAYNRPDDGSLWRNRCRAEGAKVIWGGVDVDGPGSGPGRWRDNPLDETLTFIIGEDGKITIDQKFSDGSGNSETFVVD